MPKPSHPSGPISAIILSAGSSSRLGRPKQLLRVDGETLLDRCLRLARSACDRVVLVVGAGKDDLLREVDTRGVRVVDNPDWPEGMGSSLRAGLQAELDRPDPPRAVLFLVVDQPLLTVDHLRALISAYHESGTSMVVSDYGKRTGVPALFDRSLYPRLLRIEGDKGARALLREYAGQQVAVPFPGGETDLDTPADLRRFRRNHRNRS